MWFTLSLDFLLPTPTNVLGRIPKKKKEPSLPEPAANKSSTSETDLSSHPSRNAETKSPTKIKFDTYISRMNAQNSKTKNFEIEEPKNNIAKASESERVEEGGCTPAVTESESELDCKLNPEVESAHSEERCDITITASQVPGQPLKYKAKSSAANIAMRTSRLAQLYATITKCTDATPAQLGLDKFDRALFQGAEIDLGDKPEDVKVTVKVEPAKQPISNDEDSDGGKEKEKTKIRDEVLQQVVYSVINKWVGLQISCGIDTILISYDILLGFRQWAKYLNYYRLSVIPTFLWIDYNQTFNKTINK